MRRVFIVEAKRTAVGSFAGALAPLSPGELGTRCLQAVLQGKFSELNVDEVIVGNVLGAGHGMNIARQIAVQSGLSNATPAYTVNKVCGSGLKSVCLGVDQIRLGRADVIIAGGVESMSQAMYALPSARSGMRMGDGVALDLMIRDGLTDAFSGVHMGVTAENIAREYGISREEQDAFAVQSQQRASIAREQGRFHDEIVPISIVGPRREEKIFAQDEYIRDNVTVEALSKLRPAFEKEGTVTAGNASGLNDGAAFVVLCSEEAVKQYELSPMAEFRDWASAGVDPQVMGLGPVGAVRRLLKQCAIESSDIDLFEANEAFAVQAIAVMRDLALSSDTTNVNGGAIAIGHPIGASGTRILVTLVHECMKREAQTGLATLCIGGGQGIAALVQRV